VPVAFISTNHIAHSALRVSEQLTGQSALVRVVPPAASAYAMPDTVLLLFVAWVMGALLMALYLTLLQLRFHAAVRLRQAGPAVLGFLRPRIVTPDGFQERFTPQEQAAILAHEEVHLARQDARVNALAAFLRCLCWFNPLIHFGARWMRIDQELACDATTVAGAISRREYANALLKSQMLFTTLPLGCDWPGPQHPLIERIALLKRKPPGAGRRFVGMGLVMVAAVSVGFGAWAAQPPVAAQSVATPPAGMMLAKIPAMVIPAMVAAPRQTARDAGPSQPVANASPTNDVEASKTVRPDITDSPIPVPETPRTVSIDTRTQSVLAALPQIGPVPEPKIGADQYPASQDAALPPKDTSAKDKNMRLAVLPTLLSLAWPASDASADTCSLTLLNSVSLTVNDNVASVPASVGTKEKQFQIDTAAPDNQMGKDAMTDFGLTAINFMPTQNNGGAGSFSIGRTAATDIGVTARGFTAYGPPASVITGNAIAIYSAKGTMFHSWADAERFTLGSMRTDHLQFVVTDLPEAGSGGILSASFFQKYDIDLNFSAHRFNMFAPNHCKGQVLYWRAPGVAKLPFRVQNGRITVRVTVDGREMDAMIDTGSQRSELQFDDADSLFYRSPNSPGVMREVDGVSAYNFGILSFGGVSIYHPHLLLMHSVLVRGANSGPLTGTLIRNIDQSSTQPSLMIGTDLLKLLHLYIAFNERMIYITQGPELPQGDAKALPVVTVTPFRP